MTDSSLIKAVNCASRYLLRSFAALESKPTEIDLDRVSKNVDTWRSLLTHLGVPVVKYKALFEESQGNPTRACFEGLVFWRGGNEPCKPPTWSVLLEALEEAEKREYAQRLREDLIGGSRDSQSKFDPHKVLLYSVGPSIYFNFIFTAC